MKYIKVLNICLFLYIVISSSCNTFAMKSEFDTIPVSNEQYSKIINSFTIEVVDSSIITDKSIVCFDVSESGLIALGFEDFDDDIVGIYKTDGSFCHAFKFYTAGSFYVEWVDNNILNICLVRSNLCIYINMEGEILQIDEILDTYENNSYWRTLMKPVRNIDNLEYSLRSDVGVLQFFAASYSKLVYTDGSGNETILYDVTGMHLFRILFWIIVIASFATYVIYGIYKQSTTKNKAPIKKVCMF